MRNIAVSATARHTPFTARGHETQRPEDGDREQARLVRHQHRREVKWPRRGRNDYLHVQRDDPGQQLPVQRVRVH
ncbi:hypothetical protein [Burkholderia ubonensis]|uniref:hypothetical protein n=1 Tax=Burkholderia ubonensis TaxID=101571 RepID=UPI000B2C6ECB|nr:hypothetical protein [Burkholderia ubonensis]